MATKSKLALGLFHFNAHWNLDARCAHRHCTESLIPFLRAIRNHPNWRVTLELSGSGLEFFHVHYPAEFSWLRNLVEAGRIELISSLYTPNLWPAFPKRDLIKSIQLNQCCLARLGLPWTRLFFSQEAFIGEGVTVLHDYFDAVICKDDYLEHYYTLDWKNPCLTRNDMKVIAASSHLLCELSESEQQDAAFLKTRSLSAAHREHLRNALRVNDRRRFPLSRGIFAGTEWLWYHCGDGNHFGAIYKPNDLARCYFDPAWSALCVAQMEEYMALGYELCTIHRFIDSLDYSRSQELPPLIDGAWNPRPHQGIFCWMGRNDTRWEDDARVLTGMARCRARLVAAEASIARLPSDQISMAEEKLDKAWASLLDAEVSDSVGPHAVPNGIQRSLAAGEEAFLIANRILGDSDTAVEDTQRAMLNVQSDSDDPTPEQRARFTEPELFGAQGSVGSTDLSPSVRLVEIELRTSEARSGVKFRSATFELTFCPSGLEESPISIPASLLNVDTLTLPLANGLIGLGPGVFLIKHTSFVHVCATIHLRENRIEFAMQGGTTGKNYSWRFYVIFGSLQYAVSCANVLNSV